MAQGQRISFFLIRQIIRCALLAAASTHLVAQNSGAQNSGAQNSSAQNSSAQKSGAPDRRVEAGLPTIHNFNTSALGYDAANCAILRDHRGLLYVGNIDGVLVYDAEVWRLISSPNYTPVFSLAVGADGTVYVGYAEGFGRLVTDSAGIQTIESLSDRLPPDRRPKSVVFQAECIGGTVWFWSPDHLYSWDGREIGIIAAPATLRRMAVLDGRLYTIVTGIGLHRIHNGKLERVPGATFLTDPDDKLAFMLPMGNGQTLVGSPHTGWLTFDGTTLRPAWTEEVRKRLPREVNCGVLLADSTFAIGTVRRGIWIIDRDGGVLRVLDESSGLRDEYIMRLYQDDERMLWAALDNGIAMVQWPASSTTYGRSNGLKGRITAIKRFRGDIYACGTQGVYRLVRSSGESEGRSVIRNRYEAVPDVPIDCNDMLTRGAELLISTVHGVFAFDGSRAHLIADVEGRNLTPVSEARDSIIVATNSGLVLLAHTSGAWTQRRIFEQISDMVISCCRDNHGTLWFGTFKNGAYAVDVGSGFESPKVRRIAIPSESRGIPMEVHFVAGQLHFISDKNNYKYDRRSGRLQPNIEGPKKFGFPSDWKLAKISRLTDDDILLELLHRWRSFVISSRDGSGRWQARLIPGLQNQIIYSYYPEDDGVVWFGGEDNLFRYESRNALPVASNPPTLIRSVFRDDTTVYYWGDLPSDEANLVITYSTAGLSIRYIAPSMRAAEYTEYRWKLIGLEDRWSEWTTRTTLDFPNLSEGSYSFHVEARLSDGTMCDPATLHFRIRPPWQRSWWAYGLYISAAIGLFVLTLRLRTRTLEQRSRQLEQTIRDRTVEIRTQSEKIRSQAEELETLDSIVRTVNKEVHLTDVLSALLQQTLLLFPHVDTAFYLQRSGDDGLFRLVATVGQTIESLSSHAFTLSAIMGDASNSLQTIQDGVYVLRGLEQLCNHHDGALTEKSKAFMGMSDMQRGGMRGFLVLGSDQQHTFHADDLRRLLRLREHVSSAVAKALAIRELEAKNQLLDQSNTQLREMQAQLIVHEKLAALGELTAGIAHEIQNPLNFVNNFSSLSLELLDELEEDLGALDKDVQASALNLLATVRGNCERIREHGMRATSIVRAMLMHTRKGGGRRETVALNEFLDQFVLLSYHGMRMLHPEHDLRLHTDYDRSIVGVKILPQEMSRVIVNICNNAWEAAIDKAARQAGGPLPEVHVRSIAEDDRIRISIRDNGAGVPEQIYGRIFEPFFTTKRSGNNAGLGLSMSYEIVTQLHKGRLSVQSVEGEYSEFVIDIPTDDGTADGE